MFSSINRHNNKIAIGRKHTRPFAINKVSTDAIIIFLHSESAANHNTCLYDERFKLFIICYVNSSNFHGTIMICTPNLFKK